MTSTQQACRNISRKLEKSDGHYGGLTGGFLIKQL